MRVLVILCGFVATVAALSMRREDQHEKGHKVVPALFDGKCYYPTGDPHFPKNLEQYMGTWYQVAGTPFGPTASARCVKAEYKLTSAGSVAVTNTAKVGDRAIVANGTAYPQNNEYGRSGVLKVMFPGSPDDPCPGPNYIVQAYAHDHAVVQTPNWDVLYVLSREQHPGVAKIGEWIEHAVALGSNRTEIMEFDQNSC
ncbi:Calycin-like protein [Polyplosphaeria fusca]|uniref:Calycin-like protein n=1 Tax=Polyplosphaeria fusca TaxID=682080 RepID=A0A9P4V893_9PLEO|nr:Calycin-like protein [Polyplosphaeria fusca]